MDKTEKTQEEILNWSHQYFAVNCFNSIWEILDKKPTDRSLLEEDVKSLI